MIENNNDDEDLKISNHFVSILNSTNDELTLSIISSSFYYGNASHKKNELKPLLMT